MNGYEAHRTVDSTDPAQHQLAPVHVVGEPAARLGHQDEGNREQGPRDADLEPRGTPGHEEQRPADVVDAAGQPESGGADQRSGHRPADPDPAEGRPSCRRASSGAARRSASSPASWRRRAGRHAPNDSQPRRQEHGPHVADADDAPDEGADGHPGQLPAVDGGEGTAPAFERHRARDHGQGGHGGRAGADPLQGSKADGGVGGDGEQERDTGHAVGDEAGDQHRAAGRSGRPSAPSGTGRPRRRRRRRP